MNTSSNNLVKRFIDKADRTTQREIETIVRGETITKTLSTELIYNEIDKSIDNLWSVLYMTGYLTGKRKSIDEFELNIPNKEVGYAFKSQIQKWFTSTLANNLDDLTMLWTAIEKKESETVERIITKFLGNTISILDPLTRRATKKRRRNPITALYWVSSVVTATGAYYQTGSQEMGTLI